MSTEEKESHTFVLFNEDKNVIQSTLVFLDTKDKFCICGKKGYRAVTNDAEGYLDTGISCLNDLTQYYNIRFVE